MSRFEIINPSDPYTIESDDFAAAAGACVLLGEGAYGLREVDGEREMPIFLLAPLARIDGWFRDNCGGSLNETLGGKRAAIADALATVKAQRERSSLNDIGAAAHGLATALRVAR